MVNKLNIIKNQSGKNTLHIEANKNKDVSNKSSSGKVLEYSIALNYKIEAKEFLTGKVIYSKTISNSKNYKSSSLYSDTINKNKIETPKGFQDVSEATSNLKQKSNIQDNAPIHENLDDKKFKNRREAYAYAKKLAMSKKTTVNVVEMDGYWLVELKRSD